MELLQQIKRTVTNHRRKTQAMRDYRTFNLVDEHMLNDIGLTRDDITRAIREIT